MKTYVYIKPGPRAWRISAAGRTQDNCDAVSAIGRPRRSDETIGVGRNKKEAFEDAIATMNLESENKDNGDFVLKWD